MGRQRLRALVPLAQAVWAHSPAAAAEIEQLTHYPARRVQLLAYPVASDWFTPGPAATVRGVPTAPFALFVGRVAPNKRLDTLLYALPELPELHAVIVGATDDLYALEARRLQRLASDLGVRDRVHWLGRVDAPTLRALYRRANVFVMPSVHEGYCIPVREAQACGVPVLAAAATALPETVGHAGRTFVVEDAADLVRQYRTLDQVPTVPATRRVAIVAPRWGAGVVGGSEKSWRILAATLHAQGYAVEVFTTAAAAHADWPVHTFPVDPTDADTLATAALDAAYRGPLAGRAVTSDFLQHTQNSSALVQAVVERRHEFAAVFAGPYPCGLTCTIAQQLGRQVLLVPCLHDEGYARLPELRAAYNGVGGLLFHSPEEMQLAIRLGITHPNARVLRGLIGAGRATPPASVARTEAYVLYCGRYSADKNVPLLLEWMQRQHARTGLRLVLTGAGMNLPVADWLDNRGTVAPAEVQRLIAGAAAVVQLSTNESLSWVVIEAWSAGVPVLGHADCAPVRGLIEHSGGGWLVRSETAFAQALDELAHLGPRRGQAGRRWVQEQPDATCLGAVLTQAIGQLREPLREQMRRAGLVQVAENVVGAWQQRVVALVEQNEAPPERPPLFAPPAPERSLPAALRILERHREFLLEPPTGTGWRGWFKRKLFGLLENLFLRRWVAQQNAVNAAVAVALAELQDRNRFTNHETRTPELILNTEH
jgi:glycosyltransferase involved in cell wall biosynthesis